MQTRTGSFLYCKRSIFILLSIINAFVLISQPENGIVAKYTFNHANANDETGRYNAKNVGVSFVEDRFGNPRSSCYLHGNYGSYLNLGTAKALKPEEATISLWVKIDIPMLGGKGFEVNPIIMVKSHDGDDFFDGYTIVYDWNLKKIVVATTLSEQMQLTVHSTDSFPLREWHHIAITYDNDFTCLYIDGKQDVKMPKGFISKFLLTDSVMVGNSANSKNHRFLCASVDDIFIYNRVLSPDEIELLYNAPDPNRANIYMKWAYRGIFILIILLGLVWFFVWRYKKRLEREREQNRINARLHDLETKAIRTQMNPHFLFNSLNTLQGFILEGNINKAEEYLATFAKLLRKLLESSQAETISLDEELEILNKYIEIEKLRFEEGFEYEISSSVKHPHRVFIPFMMVQPFVENSIWHGLMPSVTNRRLSVRFSEMDEKRIKCLIDDNGVGREYSAQHKDPLKKKSLALNFIRQRLELIRKASGIDCDFRIIDKKDPKGQSAGTSIELILPKLN